MDEENKEIPEEVEEEKEAVQPVQAAPEEPAGDKETAEAKEPARDDGQSLDKVYPNKFTLHIAGRTREVKFGNLALAKIERRYGSVTNFKRLEEDMEQKPMETVPWLLSICMKDMEAIEDTTDGILSAMDDSDLSITEVTEVISQAMTSALSNFLGSADAGKKKKKN